DHVAQSEDQGSTDDVHEGSRVTQTEQCGETVLDHVMGEVEIAIPKETTEGVVSSRSPEPPAVILQGDGKRKMVTSDSIPIRRKQNLSCPPARDRSI
ncbi:hypothetical protein A2U01_0074875, partial [Trifolium medium]|nr:hypothetical protein [Trifolium medium]